MWFSIERGAFLGGGHNSSLVKRSTQTPGKESGRISASFDGPMPSTCGLGAGALPRSHTNQVDS